MLRFTSETKRRGSVLKALSFILALAREGVVTGWSSVILVLLLTTAFLTDDRRVIRGPTRGVLARVPVAPVSACST